MPSGSVSGGRMPQYGRIAQVIGVMGIRVGVSGARLGRLRALWPVWDADVSAGSE